MCKRNYCLPVATHSVTAAVSKSRESPTSSVGQDLALWMMILLIYLLTPTTVVGVKRLAASVCDCVCESVCPHDKTKTAKTTITKLAITSPRPPVNIRSKSQRLTGSQSGKNYWMRSCGRREFAPLSSVHPLVLCLYLACGIDISRGSFCLLPFTGDHLPGFVTVFSLQIIQKIASLYVNLQRSACA